MTQQNSKFTPSASMPRIWWEILAAVHRMTEQRIQANYANIQKFLGRNFSQSKLSSLTAKGLLIKDQNSRVVFGLSDSAYEFLREYFHQVTSEADAKTLGFYRQRLIINASIRGVAA